MEQNNNAETFEEIINLERIDVNLFRGRTPSNWPFPRIYGGQTMAQALRAAGFTVDPTFVVHSLHASFYLPGNTKVPILYNVERTRDGRSFVARRVIAVQNGDPIFSANISFQRPEEGVEHQDPIPPAPLPRDLPSYDAILEAVKSDPSLPSNAEQILRASFELPFPVDLRKGSALISFSIDLILLFNVVIDVFISD
jgi:acyl-CoA thioesterase-2